MYVDDEPETHGLPSDFDPEAMRAYHTFKMNDWMQKNLYGKTPNSHSSTSSQKVNRRRERKLPNTSDTKENRVESLTGSWVKRSFTGHWAAQAAAA
jgi:hypothetical protein